MHRYRYTQTHIQFLNWAFRDNILFSLTSVNSLMLMLLACLATFLLTSSRAVLGWEETDGGLLVMDGSGSSEDMPMLDKAAVMVA